jgi:Na+-translocating ferredoxin:NAD+ oxidoreductase RnfC subunit
MLLALYNGCIILLIGILVFMELYLVFKRRGQVMLCTECQQCVSACPRLAKGCNPIEIMKAAKSGQETEAVRNAIAGCISCGKCRLACPRGLAPYLEIDKWARAVEAEKEKSA